MADKQLNELLPASASGPGAVFEEFRDYGDTTFARTFALREDLRPTFARQILVTLSGTPNTVTTVTLPAGTIALRFYASVDVRYNINAAPAALATSSATTVAAAAFGVGNTAKATLLDSRIIPTADGTTTTIQLASTTASATVLIECW